MIIISFFFRKPQTFYGRRRMEFIGIDLHTNRFTCCYLDEEGNRRMKTYELSSTDIGLFLRTVHTDTSCVLIEATVNTFVFVKLIGRYVKQVLVANTFELKSISFTNKKTNKVDAYKLARILKAQIMSGEEQVHEVMVPPQHIQDLRSLLKQNLMPFTREYIFGKKRRKEIRGLCKGREVLDFQINFLFDQLEQLEMKTDEVKGKILEQGSRYMKEIDILTSMKGISVFTAIALIADIITVNRFSNSKKFSNYLRSTPKVESSNEKTIIKSTNKCGRKVAITLLSQALNHYRDTSPYARAWYERLRQYKKPGVVRMGLCRKMICELYQMLKKGEYHYFRDPLNHRAKMEEYFKLLEERYIQIPEGLKKSA
jgi:transposase